MIKKLKENYCYHNVLDLVIGLIILIFYLHIGEKAFSFFALYVLHLLLNRKPDEREQLLMAKSYAIVFNITLAFLWIFDFYCKDLFKPIFVFSLFLILKGIVGLLVFLRN